MSSRRLYVIGNGFDLFHGLPSSYLNFKDFVRKNNGDLFELLESYFDESALWTNFEETLADFNIDRLMNNTSQLLVDYGADDWSDAYHHEYKEEIDQILYSITIQLKSLLTQWVLQLHIPKHKKLEFSKNSKFLSFNYTNTLELAYKIPKKSILYLHNKAVNKNSTLIIGHSRIVKSLNDPRAAEYADPRVWNGNAKIDAYFLSTYKQTDQIISINRNWFKKIANVTEIFVLGHSLGNVDIKYFVKINHLAKSAKWIVTYHNTENMESHMKTLQGLGIKREKITLLKMEQIN